MALLGELRSSDNLDWRGPEFELSELEFRVRMVRVSVGEKLDPEFELSENSTSLNLCLD